MHKINFRSVKTKRRVTVSLTGNYVLIYVTVRDNQLAPKLVEIIEAYRKLEELKMSTLNTHTKLSV